MTSPKRRVARLARATSVLMVAGLLAANTAWAKDDDIDVDDDVPVPTPTLAVPTVVLPAPTPALPTATVLVPPVIVPLATVPVPTVPVPTATVSAPTVVAPIATEVADKATKVAEKAADKATKAAEKATKTADKDDEGNGEGGGDDGGGDDGDDDRPDRPADDRPEIDASDAAATDDGDDSEETDGEGEPAELEEIGDISEQDAAGGRVYRRESAAGEAGGEIEVIDADPRTGRDGYLAGELVVQLEEGAAIEALNARFGTSTVTEIGPAPFYLLRVPADLALEETALAVRDHPDVAWVDLNFVGQAPEGRPGYFFVSSRPSLPTAQTDLRTQLEEIGGATCVAGLGIIVAVLDTGVDLEHPDLAGRIAGVPFDVLDGTSGVTDVGNEADDDGDGRIDEMTGHGTHVAGIIARVAPDASILPIRVLNSDGVGDAYYLAEAIFYAVEQGANVINLSLGTSRDARVIREAVDYAHERGVLVVAAAGNNDRELSEYPAAYGSVLSVNAIDDERRRAGFSNYGESVDVAAPGVDIVSAAPGGGYLRWSGTSMSTPFVSATAALVASTDGEWEPDRVARRLVDSAVALPEGRRGESDMIRIETTRATGCEPLPQP